MFLPPSPYIPAGYIRNQVAGVDGFEFGAQGFDLETGDLEVRKSKVFDRMLRVGPGGSLNVRPLVLGDRVIAGCYNHILYCLSARSGGLAWKFAASGPVGSSSPATDGRKVFFGSWDQNAYALDAGTGELCWKFATGGGIVKAGCLGRDSFCIGSKDGHVYCLDRESGGLVWKFRTFGIVNCAVMAADGKVFFGSYDRNFYCLSEDDGRLLWKFPTQGEISSLNGALAHGGMVYFASMDNNLYAVNAGSGRLAWKLRVSDYGSSVFPVLAGGFICHAARDGSIIGISLDGRIIWRFGSAAAEAMGAPLADGGCIFTGSGDRNLYCLDAAGRPVWKFPTQGQVWGQPAIWGDSVIFGSWDCNLYSVDKDTGAQRWKYWTGGSPCHVPPPYESFRVQVRIPKERLEEKKKLYDTSFAGEAEDADGLYKSRITYQISTHYREKGKYQDSADDGL